jgi:hypothetical protein
VKRRCSLVGGITDVFVSFSIEQNTWSAKPLRSSTFSTPQHVSSSPRSLSPSYGIYRDDKIPASNVLHFDRIEQGTYFVVPSLAVVRWTKLIDADRSRHEDDDHAQERAQQAAGLRGYAVHRRGQSPSRSLLIAVVDLRFVVPDTEILSLFSQVVGRCYDFFYLR